MFCPGVGDGGSGARLVSPNLLNSPKHHEFLPHHLVTTVQELVVDE